jgi:hypothetical protein
VLKNFSWGLNEALHIAHVSREAEPALLRHEIDDELHHLPNNALQVAGHMLAAYVQGC